MSSFRIDLTNRLMFNKLHSGYATDGETVTVFYYCSPHYHVNLPLKFQVKKHLFFYIYDCFCLSEDYIYVVMTCIIYICFPVMKILRTERCLLFVGFSKRLIVTMTFIQLW